MLIGEHLDFETDRGGRGTAHSTTGVVSYCQASVQAVRCDGKLLPSVTAHIRSVASALLCRIAHLPSAAHIGANRLTVHGFAKLPSFAKNKDSG